jgi:6-phosphogluconolactonase (cycloisomerase 2 family)
LYVANYGTSDISQFAIDQATGALSSIGDKPVSALGGNPVTVQLDADGHHAYVPNYDTMDMTVFDIDANSGQLVNPRRMYTRPAVRRLAFYEGAGPVKARAKWLIATDAAKQTINSYAVSGENPATRPHFQLKLDVTPGPMAVHPRGGLLFMADAKSKHLDVYRLGEDGKIAKVTGSSLALDGTPRGLRVNQRGSHLYVITQAPNEYVSFSIDIKNARLKLAEKVTLPADSKPVQLLASPTERLNFVLDGVGDRIFTYRYLDAAGPVMYELTQHGSPFAAAKGLADMVVDATGRYGLVLSTDEASVVSYAIPGRWGPLKKVQQRKVGQRPVAVSMSPGGRDLYVLDAGKPGIHLLQLDSATGALQESAPVLSLPAVPAALAIDPSGRFAYLRYASRAGLTRYEIDVASGRLTNPKEVLNGLMPSALAFTTVFQ